MPNSGDKVHARDIGKISKNLYTWFLCPQCRVGRWVAIGNLKHSKTGGLCKRCYTRLRGDKSPHWKGGRHKKKDGYIEVKVLPDDFFYPMASQRGFVLEHRLVMAKHLGRCLHRWEIVHHRNHIRDDNRIENLQLVSDDRHNQITLLEKRITFLEDKICDLQKNIKL